MKRLGLLSTFCFFYCSLMAQAVTSGDIYLGLRKLNVLGTVLYVAAHPDDENTRLLTYFAKDRLYRTGYLSMTRGDGGQNLIGNEQGIALGLIRTQELLSARRMDGAEQFFTRAYDFGFSKNPEETFSKWDKEKILSDVVWVIRKFQPDVIITRFPTTGEGGHGHHTASAILANEAFAAAADVKRFPEQLKYVQPWQAKRILMNGFTFGNVSTERPSQFRLDVGGFNAVLGKSYGEIAAESRSQHKSQGFGVAATRGEAMESFALTGGARFENDLFDGVPTSWHRLTGGGAIQTFIDNIIAGFDFLHPENSVKPLVQLYQSMNNLPPSYWKHQKLAEVQKLVEQCSGLFADVFTTEAYAVQTDSARINFSLNNRQGIHLTLKHIRLDDFDSSLSQSLQKNRNVNFSKAIYVPATKPITQPYWLQNKMAEGYFNVMNQEVIGEPDVQPAFVAELIFTIEGQDFNFKKPVRYRYTDPVRGELYQPFIVMPLVTFNDVQALYLKNKKNNSIELGLKAYKNLQVPSPQQNNTGNSIEDTLTLLTGPFSLQRNQTVSVSYPVDKLKDRVYKINIAGQNHQAGKILTSINYSHIPSVNYFTDAITTVKTLDLKTAGSRVGYIVGAGDNVPEALEQMGYEVVLLTDKNLSRNHLDQFDAIITGVRAYNTNDWMNKHFERLMKYVEDGGNLIVQYNTSTQIGPVRAKMSPYNFTISRNRVTDENAVVNFLKPGHAVLNFPNKITQDDFKDWVQERSIYHALNVDPHFESILAMSDRNETSDNGSLIIAPYGKGFVTYTGIVFFRQLPAGVPGAFRLMANLIALNAKKAF